MRLTIANRDTESHEFVLQFDKLNFRWQFVAETGNEDDEEDQFFELLNFLLDETPTWNGTATQLCAARGVLDPTFSTSPVALAKKLKSHQEFMREQHCIECNFTRNKSARIIELTRDVIVVDYEIPNQQLLELVG